MNKITNKDWLEIQEIIPTILEDAKKRGATDAEACGVFKTGFSTNVRLGETETIEFNRDKSLAITIYKGKRKGSAATADISREAITSTLDAALRIADFTEEDPFSGLADKENMATEVLDLDLYHPWELSNEEAILIAKQCEEAARSHDPRITNSEGANFSTAASFYVYGNTLGFVGSYPTTHHSLSVAVIAKEKDSMERDHDYTIARDVKDLESGLKVGREAAIRTVRRLNARKLKTCQAPVIFAAEIAGGLLGHFLAAISGPQLYRKSSFLLDHLGKQIFPKFIHLEENPHIPKGLGSVPFDQEGVAIRKRDIISEGVLQGYVLSSYSARKLGLKTTGNAGGVHNLFVSHSSDDLNQLLKKMHKGLLVTELMGQGINLVTGDYSRGAFGFWVENGEIQYPVHEVTIAGNLKEMFLNLSAIGNDIERRSSIFTGSILIDQMTIAGS